MSKYLGELQPGTLFYKTLANGEIVTLVSLGKGYAFGLDVYPKDQFGHVDYNAKPVTVYDKCRFEMAQVLQIEPTGTNTKRGRDWRGRRQKRLDHPARAACHKEGGVTFIYPEEGELVEPHRFDEVHHQCAAGIHGFLSREDALNY